MQNNLYFYFNLGIKQSDIILGGKHFPSLPSNFLQGVSNSLQQFFVQFQHSKAPRREAGPGQSGVY